MAKTRRKTEPTARLSEQMKEVLLWVYRYEPPETEPQSFTQTAAGEIVVSTDRLVNRFAPWRPSVFIGEKPTPSKRTTLSNTLKRLEERGLLNRYSVAYKDGVMTRLALLRGKNEHMRTTHVDLTRNGALFALSLTEDGFDLEEHEAQKEHRLMKNQAEGLAFASKLLYREQLMLMKERGSSSEMLENLDRINSELEQLPKHELETKARQALSAVRDSLRELRNKMAEGS